jgi:hypothetical protein
MAGSWGMPGDSGARDIPWIRAGNRHTILGIFVPPKDFMKGKIPYPNCGAGWTVSKPWWKGEPGPGTFMTEM